MRISSGVAHRNFTHVEPTQEVPSNQRPYSQNGIAAHTSARYRERDHREGESGVLALWNRHPHAKNEIFRDEDLPGDQWITKSEEQHNIFTGNVQFRRLDGTPVIRQYRDGYRQTNLRSVTIEHDCENHLPEFESYADRKARREQEAA